MKKVFWIGVPAILLVSLIGWRIKGEKAAEAELEAQSSNRRNSSPAVEVALVGRRPLEETIEAVGTLESPSTVHLSPKASSRIASVSVREGDVVRAGQVLVELDSDELDGLVLQQQAAVNEAKARLAEAELTSGSTDVGVSAAIRQQQAALASAQADYNQAGRTVEAQVAAAESVVTDARARLEAARAGVKNADAQLVAARSGLKNAEAKLNRAKLLYEKGYVAAREVEDAQTLVDTAEAAVGVRQGERDAAASAVTSASAQLSATEKQLAITKQRGTADIASAKARLDQARAALDSATANRSQSSAYRANLNALRANVAVAEAQLRQAQTRRADSRLVSPITGRVTRRSAEPGSVANANEAILTIQSLDWLFVKVGLPVVEAGNIREGQSVRIQIDAFPGERFGGTITEINPSADERTRQFVVRTRIENPDEKLRPGMFARVSMTTSLTEPEIVVPKEAVKGEGVDRTVMVVDADGKAATRKIQVGTFDGRGFAVTSGLKVGDRVIILSYNPVRDGQTVAVSAEVTPDGERRVLESKTAQQERSRS